MAVNNTQTQQDPNDLLSQLTQWAQNGGTQAPNNVTQSSSPEMSADSANSIVGGQQGNQGNFSGGGNPSTGQTGSWNPNTGLSDNHIKILQGLIDKSNKSHAQDFINQVGPDKAQALVDLHNMTSPGNNQNQSQGQATSQTQTSGSQSPSTNNTNSGDQQPVDAIQDQAQKIALQKPGLLMSIFRGTFEENKAIQLENLAKAQTITQGGPPMSPTEKATAIGNWNSALLKQHQDYQQDLSEQMKSSTEGLDALIKNTPTPTKLADWTNYNKQIENYQTNIKNIAQKQAQGFNKYINLKLNNPLNSQQNVSSKAQELSQKVEGGIYKDAKGNTAKYMGGKFVPVTGGK